MFGITMPWTKRRERLAAELKELERQRQDYLDWAIEQATSSANDDDSSDSPSNLPENFHHFRLGPEAESVTLLLPDDCNDS